MSCHICRRPGGEHLGYGFVATKSLSYLKHWRELYPNGHEGKSTAVDAYRAFKDVVLVCFFVNLM